MNIYQRNELTCKPLDTYSDVLTFLQNPPAWRSLCKEITPHSEYKLRNSDCNKHEDVSRTLLDGPRSFCHYDPDAPEPERHHAKSLPKTLVCHDMANGYHDDCMIDGTCNYDAYTFYNWAGVDIFCYFSHHLVTIPPLGWINVGHDHGVKVIGTVITEWADGIEFWDEVLASEEEYKNFASALVAIAKTLKFDGWLLNVENKIAKPEMLVSFVRHLHELLHRELRAPELIWYDSVTVDGHLNWQNALNHKNKIFFDACDGLFTNYSWSPEDVAGSARLAAEAGRLTDLYVGIDVWGRNFYGGGQFNIQEAVELAHSHGCSLAIFAPAWTHEALGEADDGSALALADDLDVYERFLLRDRALWDSVWGYLTTALPTQLPFATSFCRGQGITRRLYGEVISPGPWYNLRHMQYQANSAHGQHGYLLSTVENIISASSTGILRDPRGIIKYSRQTPAPVSQEALAEAPREEHDSHEDVVAPPRHADSVACLRNDAVGDDAPPGTAEPTDPSSEPKLTLKRKMKNVFKHIFSNSKAKREENTVEHANGPAVDARQKVEATPEGKPAKLEEIPEPESSASKPARTSGVRIDEPQEAEERHVQLSAAEDEEAGGRLAGQSMVRMSVSIQLRGRRERTRYGVARVPGERACVAPELADAFVGGACLRVSPADEHARDQHRQIRLMHCDFVCEDALIFCVVTKLVVGHEEQFLNVKVRLREASGAGEAWCVLVGRDVPQALHSAASAGFITSLAPVACAAGARFRALQRHMLLHRPGFYVPVDNSYGWTVRYYEVKMAGWRVTSINCDTGLRDGPILLGYLGVCPMTTEDADD